MSTKTFNIYLILHAIISFVIAFDVSENFSYDRATRGLVFISSFVLWPLYMISKFLYLGCEAIGYFLNLISTFL